MLNMQLFFVAVNAVVVVDATVAVKYADVVVDFTAAVAVE